MCITESILCIFIASAQFAIYFCNLTRAMEACRGAGEGGVIKAHATRSTAKCTINGNLKPAHFPYSPLFVRLCIVLAVVVGDIYKYIFNIPLYVYSYTCSCWQLNVNKCFSRWGKGSKEGGANALQSAGKLQGKCQASFSWFISNARKLPQ